MKNCKAPAIDAVPRLKRWGVRLGAPAAALLVASAAHAELSFTFNFSGSFVTDPNAAAQRAAMVTAGQLFSDMFATHFSNSGNIVLDASGSNNPASNTLASAASHALFAANLPAPGVLQEVVRTKLTTGVDVNGADSDGQVDVNFGAPWELHPDTPATSSFFDFFAAAFHEFTHTLGFAGRIDQAGTNGLVVPDEWNEYDLNLADKNGNKIIKNDFSVDHAAWDPAVAGGTGNGVYWGGANGVAANGGNLVALYSPNPYRPGSSTSHLDKAIFPDAMMKHDRDFGAQEARDYNGVEVGILQDIGYTLAHAAAVPEPASHVLVLVALMGAGLATQQRRKP